MAPKSALKKRRDSPADNVFQVEQEAPKAEKIALLDGPSLKRALDEAVIEAVADAGSEIDNTYVDLKIVIGLLACGVACLAQFYPKKYPSNFWVLVSCVAAYVVLSTLMTVVATVFEKDSIALTRAAPDGLPALAIATRLPRFEQDYTLCIKLRGMATTAGGSNGGSVSLTRSVGAYFHEDGHLCAEAIRTDTQQLMQRLREDKSK